MTVKKNILIRGGGTINKGAEAMVLSTAKNLQRHLPYADIYATVSSKNMSTFPENRIFEISCSLNPFEKKFLNGLRIFNNKFKYHFDIDKCQRIIITKKEIRYLPKIDAVVDVSGFAYGDDWKGRYVVQTLLWMKKFKHTGTRFIFLPQAWGPFEETKYKDAYRKMLDQADLFYARDSVSQRYLSELLKKAADTISLSNDIAIGYKEGSAEKGEKLLIHVFNLSAFVNPIVVICPNRHLYLRSESPENFNNYIRLLKSIIKIFLEKKVDIVLLPNEINSENGPLWDDRFVCQTLFDIYKDDHHVYFSNNWFSAEQIQSILSHADFVIASRFHSSVFSLSSGVPVFCLSWSHKYHELMALYGLKKYCIDPFGTDTQTICTKIMAAFQDRESSKILIQKRQKDISDKLSDMWLEVSDLLR